MRRSLWREGMAGRLGTMFFPALLFLQGCSGLETAPPPPYLARQASLAEDVASLQQEIRSLKAPQEENDRRFSDGAFTRPLEKTLAGLSRRIDALDARMSAVEKEAADDRIAIDKKFQAVIEVVESENAQLKREIRRARTAARGVIHTVQEGETLAVIANTYGVRPGDLVEANNIKDPDRIHAGQKLAIPGGETGRN
ncbi:MAG: LysM peptidoglycan-binding domain-containing protein [Candidatus Aureabacteria bacterium]|nr:LysM peptidoglycan-binding domain-containing protein [Candidatus Auribacterota bacterium]